MSAEYSARAHLGTRTDIIVTSAGTGPIPQKMRPEVRDRLVALGIDPVEHEVRKITKEIVSDADLVVAMGLGHQEYVHENFQIRAPYFLEIAKGHVGPLLDVDEKEFDHKKDLKAAFEHAIWVVDTIWGAMPDFLKNYQRFLK